LPGAIDRRSGLRNDAPLSDYAMRRV